MPTELTAPETTLDELYDTHPLEWTESHIARIVASEREWRTQWTTEQSAAKSTQRRPKVVSTKKVAAKKKAKEEADAFADGLDDLFG